MAKKATTAEEMALIVNRVMTEYEDEHGGCMDCSVTMYVRKKLAPYMKDSIREADMVKTMLTLKCSVCGKIVPKAQSLHDCPGLKT